jgi:tripartite-type tricarboxylate transporter receptor subunit TctC
MVRKLNAAVFAGAMLAAASQAGPASADDFYKGKTITIISTMGGLFEINARLLSQHMPKHIPGQPDIIVQVMRGAGHSRGANHMALNAAQDGTFIGTHTASGVLMQALGDASVRYDVSKIHYIGSTGTTNNVGIAWHTSGVTHADQVFKQGKELVIGGPGFNSNGSQLPVMMREVFGAKFKVIPSYSGGEEVDLAVERGEVQGRFLNYDNLKATRGAWIKDKKINIFMQIGMKKDDELPHAPLLLEYARNDQERALARFYSALMGSLGAPYYTQGGVPKDRVDILRTAFAKTMADPEYRAAVEKAKIEVKPPKVEELADMTKSVLGAPPSVIETAKKLLRPN